MRLKRRDFLKLWGAGGLGIIFKRLGVRPALKGVQRTPGLKTWDARAHYGICSYCSVGCGVISWVKNGRLVYLEGDPDNPINEGTLCPKGQALLQLSNAPERLSHPLYRAPGSDRWERISWDQALDRIARRLQTAREEGWVHAAVLQHRETREPRPCALNHTTGIAIVGSALVTNEEAYLTAKLAAVLGIPYFNHQARNCTSPMIEGVGATLGRGVMSQTYTDIRHARVILCFNNPAETQPIAMRHVEKAKERGGRLVVVDPRFTRTAARADKYVQIRAGTDIAFVGALIHYILEHHLYDPMFVEQFTNARYLVDPRYSFQDGLFNGFDPGAGQYDPREWRYQLGPDGTPRQADRLDAPGTVFSLMRAHFSRYDLDTAARITGASPQAIEEVARLLGTLRPGAVMFSVNASHHTAGVQYIRAYTMLQLLLGNFGRAGGGLHTHRGQSNVQGATDMGHGYTHFSVGLPVPTHAEEDLAAYARRWGEEKARRLVALLRAWFGEAAHAGNDWGYGLLPRRDGTREQGTVDTIEAMERGEVKALLCIGHNPVVSFPHQARVLNAFRQLKVLMVTDLFRTETAEFWRAPDSSPESVATEVFLLPAAAGIEKDGSRTNSARWVQWTDKGPEPPGEAQSDLWILDQLFRRLRHLYADSTDPKDAPVRLATWDYGDPPDPEGVLREISGRHLDTGRPVTSVAEARKALPGSVAVGCWLYAGIFAAENRSKRRDNQDRGGLGIYPGWAYAWPDNVRILYNRASCGPDGRPLDPGRKVVWWDPVRGEWTGVDTPDLEEVRARPASAEGRRAFWETGEGVGRLFAAHYEQRNPRTGSLLRVSRTLRDAPFPEHYEPVERPVENPLHPLVPLSPAVKRPLLVGDLQAYPYVLITFRLCEQHAAGAATRNLTWLNEMMPEAFVELSQQLAARIGVGNGDWVEVSTARGRLVGRAAVTDRLRPLLIDGQPVEQVAIPWHWGFCGLSRGDSANTLTIDAVEPTARTPAYKACLCNIHRYRR